MQEEEEKEEDALDADALERKRIREAEEWRLKQLRAGVSSEDNSNFQVCSSRSLHSFVNVQAQSKDSC